MSKHRNKLVAFIIAETPVHAGGSEQIGLVDLPIQRERHTQYPKIEASSIKGAIRKEVYYRYKNSNNKSTKENNSKCKSLFDKFDKSKDLTDVPTNQLIECLFGGETDAEDKASSISFSDAKILLFPVKNPKTVFAWITSPHVLHRFNRESNTDNDLSSIIEEIPLELNSNEALVSSEELLLRNKTLILEEYSFEAKNNDTIERLAKKLANIIFGEKQNGSSKTNYWENKLEKNLVILPDNAFRDFVVYSTEIVTRIKIDPETKTVGKGALFNEEFLPEDTIMYTVITSQPPPKYNTTPEKVLSLFKNLGISTFQVGADATLGKGIVKLRIYDLVSSNHENGDKTP